MNTQYSPIGFGTGTKVHLGRKTNGRYTKSLCGIAPNRNSNILRMIVTYPEGTEITCEKCLALLAKIAAQQSA